MTFAGKSVCRTQLRKHYVFKRVSAGTWPCKDWVLFVSCFFFSTLTHASLLIPAGASRCSSSTLVGIRHPGIDLHASFSSGSSLEACGDLAQTGYAYSVAESDKANAVVQIMLVFQPHLEFANFFMRLFRVAPPYLCCLQVRVLSRVTPRYSDGGCSPGLFYSI